MKRTSFFSSVADEVTASDRIKGLIWEGDGFLLLYKRLELGGFSWPRTKEELENTPEQYQALMQGVEIVLSETLEASHVVECIEKAKKIRRITHPLIIHTDRGCQYVLDAFRKAGSKSSAIIYSIAETSKANNLNQFRYLDHVLTVLKDHQDDTDYSFGEGLLPWSVQFLEIRRSKSETTNL